MFVPLLLLGHTESLSLYSQSAAGNQVLTNSWSLVSSLIIHCHVFMFSRNTTISNYRHFLVWIANWITSGRKPLISFWRVFFPLSGFSSLCWVSGKWINNGEKNGQTEGTFYFFFLFQTMKEKKENYRWCLLISCFKQLLVIDYSSWGKREKKAKHWIIAVCQSRNSSKLACKIALAITAKCQLSGYCYIKLLLTSSHESINFQMKPIKEHLLGKIRLFVHVHTFVWIHLQIDFYYEYSHNQRLLNPRITKYGTKVRNTHLLLA